MKRSHDSGSHGACEWRRGSGNRAGQTRSERAHDDGLPAEGRGRRHVRRRQHGREGTKGDRHRHGEAKLTPHLGHKIDITGTAVDAKTAESRKPAPSKADHYMKITAVKMVSATCP